MSEKKFLKIKLEPGEVILDQSNFVLHLNGFSGGYGKILKTNQRVVFVSKHKILGFLFDIFFPRTTIDISLSYSKISKISLGKFGRSTPVVITHSYDGIKYNEYKFIINKPEKWIAEVEKELN
jgi:hypothetical protein